MNTHHDTTTEGEGEKTLDPRRCSHIRDNGEQCKGWKMRDSDLCPGHAGVGLAANPQAAGNRGRARAGELAEQRREQAETAAVTSKKGLRVLLAQRLEEHADKIAARLASIIEDGSDADALRAIESWTSRVYGRPTEHVEVAEKPRTLEELRAMPRAQRLALLADIEQRRTLRLVDEEQLARHLPSVR